MSNINKDAINAILALNSDFCKTQAEAFASEKSQAFFLDKKGNCFERGNFPIGTIVKEADFIPFTDVEEVKTGIHLSIPKIPLNILQQVVSFFRDVCEDSKDEAFVRIYLDKNTNEYVIHCPKQKISGASVNYEITDEYYEKDCLVVMDIHSHNTMNAFFSGTDDKDEKNPGKLFMVLGHLNTHNIEFKLRTFMKEYISVDFFDVFEKPEVSIMIGENKMTMALSNDAIINGIFETVVDYPEEWKNNLEKRSAYFSTDFTGKSYPFYGSFGINGGHHQNKYSKTRYPGIHDDRQLTLFGNGEDEENIGEGFPITAHIPDFDAVEEYNEDDLDRDIPISSSIDADYEKGIDAGMSVTDEMEEQNQFFISGVIDGLEQAGILEDIITQIKKNGLI